MNWTVKEIKEIINTVRTSGINAFEYENNNVKLKIDNGGTPTRAREVVPSQVIEETVVSEETEVINSEKYEEINAPLVGVFYESPSPDAEPFVKEGQSVKKGEVICIIEAMKVMNEIKAPRDCTIKKILLNNEDVVEHDQAIFLIE